MTTDALVSELRDVFRVDHGETLHPRHPKYLGNLAADAIARLTRELGEAKRAAASYKAWDFPADLQALTVKLEIAETELAQFAKFIVWHKPEHFRDHACKICVPEDRVVFPGGEDFVCGFHKAKALLEQSPEGQEILARALKESPHV